MNLTCSKTITTALIFGDPYHFQEQTNYKVFDGEKIIGEFFYTSKECFFSTGDKKIRLKIRRRSMLLPKVSLVDQSSGAKIGQFTLPYLLSNKFDQLILGADIYRFEKLEPDIKYSIFKKNSQGHYKFGLSNKSEAITYTFKLNFPRIALGNPAPKIPFEGTIDCRSSNILALLAGFYLIESELDQEVF
ncbi:MAG TPA: hypothetical protein VGN00_04675 [Puia sp.]